MSILWFIGFLHLPQVLTENRCTSAERPFSKELFFCVAFVGHKKGHEEWSSRFSCTARSLLWACFLNIFKKPSSRQNSLILRLERSYFLFALACSYTRTFLYCHCKSMIPSCSSAKNGYFFKVKCLGKTTLISSLMSVTATSAAVLLVSVWSD